MLGLLIGIGLCVGATVLFILLGLIGEFLADTKLVIVPIITVFVSVMYLLGNGLIHRGYHVPVFIWITLGVSVCLILATILMSDDLY